jgi:hypothetical protein
MKKVRTATKLKDVFAIGITPMWMSIFQYQNSPGIKGPTDFSYQASISMFININL